MSTPSAKRRRVNTANATLRKPFQSPVIRRPAPAAEAAADGTPGSGINGSKTPDAATSNRSSDEVYSSGSPSVPSQLGALRPASTLLNPSKTPAGSARQGSKRKKPWGTQAGASGPDNGRDDDDNDSKDDNPFMALVKAHRKAGQDAMIRDVGRRLETVQQARRIEGAPSEGGDPEGPADQELRGLVAKWKGAGRAAADELFEMVRGRVDSSGGPKAWRAMRQRQAEFYRGFDQEWPATSRSAGGGGGDDDDERKLFAQDEVESSLEKEQRLQGGGRAKGDADKDEDEDELVSYPGFLPRVVMMTDLFDRNSTWR